jgi:hypothetical protein
MMQMLRAGGVPVLTDGVRVADAHNPHGYLEYEPVKALRRDASWLREARGRALKVIHALLGALPATEVYRVIVMRRDPAEVVASQNAMLGGDDPGGPAPDRVAAILEAQLEEAIAWMAGRPEFDVLEVAHADAVARPAEVAGSVRAFLGRDLDVAAMAAVVDPALHRRKAG